jgi:hypothetical protein
MSPPAKGVLHAIGEKRRHGDRDGDQEPAGYVKSPPPKAVACDREQHGIDEGYDRERAAAKLSKRQRGEQAHGADHDQGAGIPEEVHEVEAGPDHRVRRSRLRLQKIPERVRPICLDHAGRHCPVDIVASNLDQCLGSALGFGRGGHVAIMRRLWLTEAQD